MQSARSIFRRASMRLRRSGRRREREAATTEDSPAPAQTAEQPAEPLSTVSCDSMEGVSSGLTGSEIAAAAVKLTDSVSSTEDVQETESAPKDAIDLLFQKQRRELMYELRTIQNSHRSVSKGDQRRRLDRFLRQHLNGDVSDNTSEGSNDSSDQSPRHRRNGVVLLELEGLSRQQSVTQRLQSSTFRHQLENMIRGTINRQEREVEAALRLRTGGLRGNRHLPLVAEGGAAETGSHVSAVSSISDSLSIPPTVPTQHYNGIPVAPPPPPAPGQVAASQQPQQQHQLPVPQQQRPQPAQQRQPQPAQQQQQQPGANRWPLPSAPWLLRNRARHQQAQEGGNPAPNNDAIQQGQRESIVHEISQLVHRQLVQETMESDFRGRLEYLMMNRLQSTETDGERVMNFIHSIQQSRPHRRNDFSHLGIRMHNPNQEAAGAAGGAAMPAVFAHEMESLRSRMDELHEMVRMSMEMQLDLQRAIRQEVSAALHQQNGTTPSASSPASQPASEGNCIICLDKEVDAVLYQCGHMCVCLTCGLRLSTMGSHCPMCRAPIRDVIRAYRSQRT